MLRTLGLFFAFLIANAFFLPLIWSSFVTTQPTQLAFHHNLHTTANAIHDVARDAKVYIDVQDLKHLALFLSGSTPPGHQHAAMDTPDSPPYTQAYYTLTVENFHLQSDFKLLSINPYRRITREIFDLWLEEQEYISFSKILKNIGDINWSNELVNRDNVSLGAVIASPSKSSPDYFYQWIRDGAITMITVVNYLIEDRFANSSVAETVMNYVENSYKLQQIDNPSGVHDDKLLNLGEPKFRVDGSPYTGSWGRPQNDGAPLRVIAIDNFMKNLHKYTGHAELFDTYHKVIKPDLEFICRYWKVNNFDLWEETFAHHFFTSLVQLKALKIGMRYFQEFNDEDSAFGEMLESEFSNLLHFILGESGFIDTSLTHIVETPSLLGKRSGLDAAILLASLLTHNDDDDVIPFDVSDGLVLNTLSELIKSMKLLYPINHNHVNLNLGVGLGRYPEDVYNGLGTSEGNPWFLCTLAGAELMFKLISDLYLSEKDLIIDSSNELFFFRHIFDSPVASLGIFKQQRDDQNEGKFRAVALKIPYNTPAFNQTVANLFQFGDSFLDVVREHVADDGSMSEQFNKYTGYMQGAEDLTWSHGSLWGANRWRKRALQYIG